MSVRLSALLCLTSLAACSNNTTPTPAKDPTYVNEPAQASTKPTLKPAALESPTPVRATTPAPDERASATTAPLVADTKGANLNAYQTQDTAQKPPAAANSDVAPDNTKINQRDRDSAALTPLDQGNGKTDLKITQQIRQAVMADGSLSFTAKNVKIITQGGKVTLRGPVNSEQERNNIEAAARKVAGVAQVDNQLEVKK